MTGSEQQPAAGWYPDPARPGGERWWDGAQWTAQVQAGSGQQTWYASAPGFPRVPAGTSSLTPWIWVLLIVPAAISLLGSILVDYRSYYATVLESSSDPSASFRAFAFIWPIYLTAFVSYVIVVVTALLDHRQLARRGFVRPFHWAWAFLNQLVYVIGRVVVTRRRGGRSALVPLWVLIALIVLGFVFGLVQLVDAVTYAVTLMPSLGA